MSKKASTVEVKAAARSGARPVRSLSDVLTPTTPQAIRARIQARHGHRSPDISLEEVGLSPTLLLQR